MELIPTEQNDKTNQSDIELVEQEREEYKLIGRYMRTRGLNLYSFNPADESLHKVKVKSSDTLHVEIENGRMVLVDKEMQKATVDSRFIYFEALRDDSAIKRVQRYRRDLTAMCNLKPFIESNTIELF